MGRKMTRRQNRWFIIAGLVGIGIMVCGVAADKNGYLSDELRELALTLLPYVYIGSGASLLILGLMPWLSTFLYMQGFYDSSLYSYMHRLPSYRFVFVITDLPSVVAKRGNAP